MDGDSLSNCAILTNPAEALSAFKRSILWKVADHGVRMNFASGADLCVPHDDGKWRDAAPWPDPHRPVDHGVRSDGRCGIYGGQRVDNCAWVDAHQSPDVAA
jgi:hypothetical protein